MCDRLGDPQLFAHVLLGRALCRFLVLVIAPEGRQAANGRQLDFRLENCLVVGSCLECGTERIARAVKGLAMRMLLL